MFTVLKSKHGETFACSSFSNIKIVREITHVLYLSTPEVLVVYFSISMNIFYYIPGQYSTFYFITLFITSEKKKMSETTNEGSNKATTVQCLLCQ